MYDAAQVARGALQNLKAELDAGLVGNLRQRMVGDVLTDFVARVDHKLVTWLEVRTHFQRRTVIPNNLNLAEMDAVVRTNHGHAGATLPQHQRVARNDQRRLIA